MRPTRSACCARASSGHTTAALPNSLMNARLFIAAPKIRKGIVSAQTENVRFGPIADISLLDHFVRSGEQNGWHGEAERLCCFQVHDEVELVRLLDW
jgi:hypothetical protein